MFHRAGLAVLREDRLLMVRRHGSRFWALPGGHVEVGETVRDALERELQEELGVQLNSENLQVLGRFSDRTAETGEPFQLTLCSGDIIGEPRSAAEIEEYTWFDGAIIDGDLPPMFVNHAWPALVSRCGWVERKAS